MNLPNLITILRILLVPVIVYLIIDEHLAIAFAIFVIAGISDGVDGFIAKQFAMESQLGTYLDPIADKLLMASIYLALGFTGGMPIWLVIAVVSRDILIVGAVLLSWMMERPVFVRPIAISKINTAVQIGYAAAVLAHLGFDVIEQGLLASLAFIVGALTIASAATYLVGWVRHMANGQMAGRQA